ncbi:calcium/sodium antiporter [Candidatus Woesearchaeota archaeon]|nr:calcium/sodium antiporter [Candidatus Woesearchaeota archaeon]
MLINILLLLAGLAILVKGSDFFVRSAASIAKKFGVSEFIIGLTLVAVGTSLPELASAVMSSLKGASSLVIGNIIGANVANIGLIVGIAATMSAIRTTREMLERDGYVLLLAAALFLLFALDLRIVWWEGAISILLYVAYMFFLFEGKKKFKGRFGFREFSRYFFGFQYILTIRSKLISNYRNRRKKGKGKKHLSPEQQKEIKELFREGLVKDFLMLALSAGMVVLGAKYLVESAVYLAYIFRIPGTVIGVLMAIGTTAPEMSVAISAARKRLGNIIMGNAIGSCITNTFLIIGISSVISPLYLLRATVNYALPFLLFMVMLLLFFLKSHWKVKRWEGLVFICLYVLFLVLVMVGLLA